MPEGQAIVTGTAFAGLFGAAGGPISFLADERLAAVTLLPPLAHGLLRLSVSWAIALLAFSAVAGRLGSECAPRYWHS